MPSRFMSAVVATITTSLITALPILGSVSAASAAPGDPIIPASPSCVVQLVSGDPASAPPAPTCYDPSGPDLDEFLVPLYYDSAGKQVTYRSDAWSPYKWDQPNSTYGAGQVHVVAAYFDPSLGGYVDRFRWTLAFNTSVTSVPTANAYWVTLGECTTVSGFTTRLATAYMRNEVGVDGRYVGYVLPAASGENGNSVFDTQPALRVLEGATVAMPLVADAPYKVGLSPGTTYTIKYWLEDRNSLPTSNGAGRRVGGEVSVYVPKCGDDSSSGGSGTTVPPTAKIKVVKRGPVYSKVKVVLGSRKATEATKYRVTIDPPRGKTIRKSYVTKFKVLKYPKLLNRTVVKVRFGIKLVRMRVKA